VKRAALTLSALLLAAVFPAAGQDAPAANKASSGAETYFGSLPTLLDQDGHPVHLYADLMKGRVVVIDAMFTSCQGACPVMSRNFEKIQDWLGERLGKEVNLISISVDPETDTPAKLKAYGTRFNARPGWTFLTGPKADVTQVLQKLGQRAAKPDDHMNLFLVGNVDTELWKKAFGLGDAAELIQIVDSVLKDRG
jgi:protein SCO1/2